jgi:drug/metabolite transporter (DMT)-like permease
MSLKFNPPPVLVLMAGSTMWGTTWIWLKAIDGMGIGPLLLSVLAYGIQFLLLLPWALPHVRRRWRSGEAPMAWYGLLTLALLSGISGIGFTIAMIFGDVVRAMLLFFLIPAWGVIMGRIFLHEPLTPIRIVAVFLALGGAVAILGPDIHWDTHSGSSEGQSQWFSLLSFSLPDWAALIAGLTLAGANVLFRHMQGEPMLVKLSIMQIGAVVFALCALLFFPEPIAAITLDGVVHSLLYGATLLLAAMLCTQYAVERLPAGRSSILMTLELLVGSLTAIWIGHEHPSLLVWLGGAMILAAALLEATSQQEPAP